MIDWPLDDEGVTLAVDAMARTCVAVLVDVSVSMAVAAAPTSGACK